MAAEKKGGYGGAMTLMCRRALLALVFLSEGGLLAAERVAPPPAAAAGGEAAFRVTSMEKYPEHGAKFPVISYAIKAHPELSAGPGDLVLSYATNTPGDLTALMKPEGLGVYVPRFIRVKVEAARPR